MNIKHNYRRKVGQPFRELISGQTYIRVDIPSPKPRVYLAVARSPQPQQATDLVNVDTGCLVGRVSEGARFRHLPDATLDTGE